MLFLSIIDGAAAPGREADRARAASLAPAERQRLRALYEAHHDVVWRVLRRTGLGAAQADDGVQQVFLVALQRLSEVLSGRERAFLCATAVLVGRRLRQGQPREQLVEELPELEGNERPDDAVEQKRQRALLDLVLSRLDDDLRAVLVLQEIEGLSKSETARALGIPEGTVASRMRRARDAFQEELARVLAERRAP